MRLHIGQSTLKGPFERYAGKLDFLELFAEPQRLPKLARLRQYKELAPPGFTFSVVLSPTVTEQTAEAEQMLDYGMKVCAVLEPRWVVLRSPATMRPSSSVERRLGTVFESVRQQVDASRIAWEPRGLWTGTTLLRAAERFGVQPVTDAREVEGAPIVYARMMRLGVGARTGSRLLESLALSFLQAEEAYLVVDGGSALPVKREFEELLQDMSAGEDFDEELSDEELSDGELSDGELSDGEPA